MRLTGAALRWPLALPAVLTVTAAQAADTRPITDSAGRRVEVPRRVERVYAAGGPASIFLYTLAPERMLGARSTGWRSRCWRSAARTGA